MRLWDEVMAVMVVRIERGGELERYTFLRIDDFHCRVVVNHAQCGFFSSAIEKCFSPLSAFHLSLSVFFLHVGCSVEFINDSHLLSLSLSY